MFFSEINQQPSTQQIDSIELPKIIHFVWAGGSKQMPIANQRRVRDWANKHSDFQIYVWVDYISAPANTLEEKKAYVEKEYKKSLGLENSDLGLLESCNNLNLKDIYEDLYSGDPGVDLAYKFFRYEIDRLRSNYGASSDILRYKILYELGGAYFDSDILAGENKLDQNANFGALDQHIIFIDPNSQDQGFIGNDAFIVTTKHNPIMKDILKKCLDSYCSYPPAREYFCQLYDNKNCIVQITPNRTGPGLIHTVFEQNNRYSANDYFKQFTEVPSMYSCEIRKLEAASRTVQANEQNWVGTRINKELSQQEFLDKIVNDSAFEYSYLKLLRFNDHFYNYYEVFSQSLLMEDFLTKLQEKLEDNKLDFSTVHVQELQDVNHWKNQLEECGDSVKVVLGLIDSSDEPQKSVLIDRINDCVNQQKRYIENYRNINRIRHTP